MDPFPLTAPLVYCFAPGPAGRTRLKIAVPVRSADGDSSRKTLRLPITIAPEGKTAGRIRAVAVGLLEKKALSRLVAEAEVPAGRYRAFPEGIPHANYQIFEVARDGMPPIRIFCHHSGGRSHADSLGAFSPKGAPRITFSTYRIFSCCRNFTRSTSRAPNTRALGIFQALSRPLRLAPQGRPVTLRPGEFLIGDPDVMIPIAPDTPLPMHFRHLLIEPAAWSEFLRALNLMEGFPLFGFDPVAHPNDPLLNASLLHLTEAMRRADEPGSAPYVQATLHQLLLHLVRGCPNRLGRAWRRRSGPSVDERLARAVRYLEAHHAEPYDRTALARAACASRQALQRLFQEHLHRSPTEYLQTIRIARAKKLMLDPARSLRQVAEAVGYADVRNFRRLFKRLAQAPGRP